MARRRGVQHLRAGAENAAHPRPHFRDPRAARRPGRGDRAVGGGRRRRRRSQARRRRRRGGRRLLPVRLCQPRPRAGGGRDHPRDRARSLRLAVARGEPGMARIRAHGLDRGQRLYRPAGLALSAHTGGAVAAAFPALARADDEIRRRGGERRHARAHADPDRHVGAGRRRHRRPPSRRRQGDRESDHLRHRRHQLRHGGAAGRRRCSSRR